MLLEQRWTSRAALLMGQLLDETIACGLKTALVVRHAQFLDPRSLSFLREAISRRTNGAGRFVVFLTVYPLYGAATHKRIVQLLSGKGSSLTLYELETLPDAELAALIDHRFDWAGVSPALRDLVICKSGRIPKCVDAVIAMIQRQRPYITQLTPDGVVHVPAEGVDKIRQMSWLHRIDTQFSMSTLHLYDTLPPAHSTVLCIVACIAPRAECAKFGIVAGIARTLIAQTGATMSMSGVYEELTDLHLLNITGHTQDASCGVCVWGGGCWLVYVCVVFAWHCVCDWCYSCS